MVTVLLEAGKQSNFIGQNKLVDEAAGVRAEPHAARHPAGIAVGPVRPLQTTHERFHEARLPPNAVVLRV